jgi:thiol-disulfide isomerase/thioredoxin
MDARDVPLGGATAWLNGEAIDPRQLRGRTVLVNFWTFTCINWVRTAPYVRAWARTYGDDGLVVIGVHTPEFTFEHDLRLVEEAVTARCLDHPVAIDDDHRVWDAFGNHFWPATYLVDGDGIVRARQFGEGGYDRVELAIQELVGVERPVPPVVGIGIEAPPDWDQLRTPETYLGWHRSSPRASAGRLIPDRSARYGPPGRLEAGQWALEGTWTVGGEHIVADEPGARLLFRFQARDAHVVLARQADDPVPFEVRLDGDAPGPSAGVDLDRDGRGLLDGSRMYNLVRQHGAVSPRTLELSFEDPGVEAYVFTFG